MAGTSDSTTTPGEAEVQDVINYLAGLSPDSPGARVRALRPVIAGYAQGSYESLLEPEDPAGVSRQEREAVGLRVAVLTPDPALAHWHRERLRSLGASDDFISAVEQFPDGSGLSEREAVILRHTDLLTKEPRAAGKADIESLRLAELGPQDIVTISQLIAFLSFQVRVLAAARLFEEEA